MAEKSTRLRQRLSGVSEQRVLAAGIVRLHEELVLGKSVDIMQLPTRANGTPRVLQASFFKRLLGGQLELKSCMESDVSGAQSDLRHLSAEQLLAIRAATSDFFTESASHNAHRNFQATLDVQLFDKLAQRCLRSGSPLPEKPEALRKLGFHVALMLGAAELLAGFWGSGDGGEESPALDCWLVRLDDPAWGNASFALFRAAGLEVEVLAGKCPDVLAAAGGGCVAVLNDQSVDAGKDRTLNWEVTVLDPAVDDVLAEAALLQRSPLRVSTAGRRSSSAPCSKRAQWASGNPSGAKAFDGVSQRRMEDLPRLLGNRAGARPLPLEPLEPLKAKTPPADVPSEEPPMPPPELGPEESERPGTPVGEQEEPTAAAPAGQEAPNEESPSEPSQELSAEALEDPTLVPAEVPAYLRTYGYHATNDESWQGRDLPVARLRVSEHAEADGHTHYVLDCALFPCTGQGSEGVDMPVLAWQASKRLVHLRKGLHDLVKQRLGDAEYSRHFGNAPFARHMGLPGTTSRLRTWCQTLSSCMSAGLLRPALVAEVLRFLDAPTPGGAATSQEGAALPGAALGSTPTAPPAPKSRSLLTGSSRARSVPNRKAHSGRSSRV